MPPSHPLRIAQISDCHVFGESGATLRGRDTEAGLAAVIDHLLDKEPTPDLVLASGDLADDASPAAYAKLNAQFSRIGAPTYFLPGNHDDPMRMTEILGPRSAARPQSVEHAHWRLLLFNSAVPRRVSGALDEHQFEWLDHRLSEDDARHILVAVHHHPTPSGTAWMDELMLEDGERLLARLEQDPRVRGLVYGHVHMLVETRRAHIKLLSCPASSIQFVPGREEAVASDEGPGYRMLQLRADGEIDSRVEFIDPAMLAKPGA